MRAKLAPFLVTLILGGNVVAAQDRGTKRQSDSQAVNKHATGSASYFAEAQAAGIPPRSPEMKRLIKALSGRWSITIRTEPNDRMPGGGLASGEEVWRPGPGGLSLIEEYHSTGDEGEIAGLGLAWWDKKKARFQVIWCDSTNPAGCIAMRYGANWERDQLVAVNEWDEAGKKFTFKEVFSGITESSFTQTLYQGEAGSHLKRLVTINATRKTR
jgi:Protein of unknown function (DUF1579)